MYDIAIIGGGINGCGIARDAAGRGLSVLLAEMSDLASGTSSWSTKLIHGGLRYLEHYEFRLVREALKEREVLWAMAPHIIHPARFILPHNPGTRPAWLLRAGLFLYDHLGGRKKLPASRRIDLSNDSEGEPLRPGFRTGFEYSDCRVDDARLVVLNARDAADRSADIRTRTQVIKANRESDHWHLTVVDKNTGETKTEQARLLVNAAGPWVDHVLREALGRNTASNVRLVQGSHIVVPRLYEGSQCYIFQNADDRIVFALPYEKDFTLIGTTDEDYDGDPGKASISSDETDYLCRAVGQYFRDPVTPEDVVWSFSGVRPLFDDDASKAQEATRDYVLRSEGSGDDAGLVNIFGGKLTTYRRLAEEVTDKACGMLGEEKDAWTAGAALPGGEFPTGSFDTEASLLHDTFPWAFRTHTDRLIETYGLRAHTILRDAESYDDLGICFGADLYEREVAYLVEKEFAQTSDDILWRRTKLGLRFEADECRRLQDWMSVNRSAR
ncbi:MAG: glycerol-3-phosphate dehydrogenase [Hyphomicrobiaceae bacterium]|nr:glycerol-3-phosphate dehydrogenase [Hyphomicrobiaceae bacterium]